MMKYSKIILLTALLALIGAGTVLSQTATVTPSQVPQGAYVNGPGGGTDDNFYWQKLVIALVRNAQGAGQTIQIVLPTDITLADVDGDGNPDDEVSFSWFGTGALLGDFTLNAAGTNATQVTLNQVNATGGTDWVLNVMIPVATSATATGSDNYAIAFSQGAPFQNIDGPTVTYRAAGALQVNNFLTNLTGDEDSTKVDDYRGLFYPYPAVAFLPSFVSLDLVEDLTADLTVFGASTGLITEDNNDNNDITFTVWAATDSTLSHISQYAEGVTKAQNYNTPGDYTQNEIAALTNAMYTGGLTEGAYWFFVTSSRTGDFPLFRSDKLTVVHFPMVNLAGWDRLNDGFDNVGVLDDDDVTLDSGDFITPAGTNATATGSGQDNVDLYVSVDDLDDNASVSVFYSTTNNLDAGDIVTTGSVGSLVVTGLTGADLLVNGLYENQEDINGFISWNWDIQPVSEDDYYAAGDYTLYVVVCDTKHTGFLEADGTAVDGETINVRHSPALAFDVLTEYNNGSDTGTTADITMDPSQSDVIMISWGKSGVTGDSDIDDSAVIELYIDYSADGLADYGNEVADEADNIRTAASGAESPTGTHLIWDSGLEDPEGKDDSWYAWNLKEDYQTTGWNPQDQAAAGFYHLYAVIDEDPDDANKTKRVVALGGDGIVNVNEDITDIEFDLNAGYARLLNPPAEGVDVNAEQTFRFDIEAFDFDSNANVGIFIVQRDELLDDVAGASSLLMGNATAGFGLRSATAGKAYCITDNDGDPAAGATWVTENSLATTPYYEMTISPAGGTLKYISHLNGAGPDLVDDEYWVYIGIDDGSYKTDTLTLTNNTDVDGWAVGDTFSNTTGATGVITALNAAAAPDQVTVHYKGPDIIATNTLTIDRNSDTAVVTVAAGPAAAAAFTAANVPLNRAPGTITISGASAAVTTPVKNLTITPMALTVTEGYNTTFSVYGSDNASTIDFIDVYVAVEKDYWTLVDDTTPFTADATFDGLLIANQVIDDDANGRWILRGSINNNGTTIDLNNTVGEALMTFQLVSTGTASSSSAQTSIYFVNEPANDRVTRFRNNGSPLSVNTLASTVTVSPRGMIEGVVDFEGRTTNAVTVAMELRDRGSYEETTDAVFIDENDADDVTAGVQVALDAEGKFTLYKTPPGSWDLVVVYPRYLSVLRGVEPQAGVDSLFVDFGTLLGGDAFGYTDEAGDVYPDNEIDAVGDVNRINTAFLATPDDDEWDNGSDNWMWADINEDDVVEEDDLAMATGNINETGANPVYKLATSPVGSNLAATIAFMNTPVQLRAGETYTIQVVVSNTMSVRAYHINMNFDATKLAFVDIRDGGFMNASSYSFPLFGEEGEVGFVNSMFGRSAAAGDGVLAEVTFTALEDGIFSDDMLGLTRASFVNADLVKEFVIDTPTGVVDNNAPTVFALGQNFPNPFNPTTTIGYTLPEDGIVTVKVYDILGRHVTTLIDGQRAAGNYSVMWNATDLDGRAVSAGVYFYTIKSGSFSDTKRMLLLK